MHAPVHTAPPAFDEIPEGRYYAKLDALPPAARTALGFLFGEPVTHRLCRVQHDCHAAFVAFVRLDGCFYEARVPMTAPEFRRLTAGRVLAALADHGARAFA